MGRMDRVNQQLKREISLIIQQEISDPRLQFVTITHVDCSADLRNAKIYYSLLSDDQDKEEIQNCFNKAKGFIRKMISQKMQLRNTPDLLFSFDKSLAYSDKIEKTISELKDDHE